jgi:hypothetical protein
MTEMYTYTIQAMPGHKAKFDGDTSVQYRVRRKHTSASKAKSHTDVIRTDLGYTEATALVKRFNDKEREARAIQDREDSRPAPLSQNLAAHRRGQADDSARVSR